MLNLIYSTNQNKYRLLNLFSYKTHSQFNGINTHFFISNLDLYKNNHKSYLPKNKEAIPAYEYYLTDCEKYYNQNYNIKTKYDWHFDW